MKRYQKLNEVEYLNWIGLTRDGAVNKKMALLACSSPQVMESVDEFIKDVSDITIFSSDIYGKGSEEEVKKYFQKYNIIGIYKISSSSDFKIEFLLNKIFKKLR